MLTSDEEYSTFTATEELDDDDFFDADSAYGAGSQMTDTATLNSSIMKFREENGRKYHSYGRKADLSLPLAKLSRIDRALGIRR